MYTCFSMNWLCFSWSFDFGHFFDVSYVILHGPNLSLVFLFWANYQLSFCHLFILFAFVWWIKIFVILKCFVFILIFFAHHFVLMVVRFNPSCLTLSHNPHHTTYFSKQVTVRSSYGKHMKRGGLGRRPQIVSSVLGNSNTEGVSVFVVSDLHTDYAENLKWVECLSNVKHKNDVLLVAGDVAETCSMFVVTMSLLKERFEHVFYVPGNHDLWCRREGQNYVRSLCFDCEIQVCALCGMFDWHGYLSEMNTILCLYLTKTFRMIGCCCCC